MHPIHRLPIHFSIPGKHDHHQEHQPSEHTCSAQPCPLQCHLQHCRHQRPNSLLNVTKGTVLGPARLFLRHSLTCRLVHRGGDGHDSRGRFIGKDNLSWRRAQSGGSGPQDLMHTSAPASPRPLQGLPSSPTSSFFVTVGGVVPLVGCCATTCVRIWSMCFLARGFNNF